jgi:hypothetical protein
MTSLNMDGEFDLTIDSINREVNMASPGNYALGHINNNKFIVEYIGRSDSDINARLKQHVGKYNKFKYSYATSPKSAFEKECKNFHDFGGALLDNEIHPDRPKDSGWKCLYCEKFN